MPADSAAGRAPVKRLCRSRCPQSGDGSLRIRWENSHHHDQLKTFPSYKHTPQLQESDEVSLKEVLEAIRKKLRKEIRMRVKEALR